MKKFLKKYSTIAFLGSAIMMTSAIEGDNFGIAIVFFCIFLYICHLNKFIEIKK